MERHIKTATVMTELLDSKFSILGIRFGLDPLLNLFPIIGDIFAAVLSLYIVWIGKKIRIPENKIHEMVGNIIFDFVLGLIPFLGIVGDVFYKSNTKNLAIIKKYYNPIFEGEIIDERKLTPAIYK